MNSFGVERVGLTSSVPLADASAIFYAAEGQTGVDAGNRPRAYVHRVTPGYLDTLGVGFVDGRDFTPSDLSPESTAVIVTRKVAERFWPGQSAIGRRIKRGDPTSDGPWLTIVGVVQDANLRGIPRNPTPDPDLFFPFNQRARFFAVVMRSGRDGAAVAAAARDTLRHAEPGIAVFDVRLLESLVAAEIAPARFLSRLTRAFAAVAVTLAVIGVYGMLSYWVRRRTAEIGIRTALGANRGQLLALVVRQAIAMAIAGVTIGAILAAALTAVVEAQLFAVRPMDWVSFAGAAGLMLTAAIAASVSPAVRALRLDPIRALRSEAA